MERRSFIRRGLASLLALLGAPGLLAGFRRTQVAAIPIVEVPAGSDWGIVDIDDAIDDLPTHPIEQWLERETTPFTLRSWRGTLYPEQATPAEREWAQLSWAQMRGRTPPERR